MPHPRGKKRTNESASGKASSGTTPPERPPDHPEREAAAPTWQQRTYEDWYAETLFDAWRTGHYGSIEDLAKAFGLSLQEASQHLAPGEARTPDSPPDIPDLDDSPFGRALTH
jgi:hypothetical protein